MFTNRLSLRCSIKNMLLVCMLFLISCQQETTPNAFVLIGKTSGVTDKTPVYLIDLLQNEIFDSTIIRKNKFRFKGTLITPPSRMMIMTNTGLISNDLWFEPGELLFDASVRSFGSATLSGSTTQLVYDSFSQKADTLSSMELRIALASETIQAYPDSRASADLLSRFYMEMTIPMVDSLFQKLSLENQASSYGERVAEYLASPNQ